ncbi:hypothetical protein HNR06_005313 [Nocardiopsis arvandica]|uniref:Uncharacterized protein n=1 Tax=Nocardiopsis sinuspersici TaxID=501010 RepID=A0A7Y9XH79_9ACTN|nr:hypothetical protein [Nocardiopsis sinuspersici]NYH55724.1 hypothetical protein [Nocardiopsis sinuspersici]
MITPPKRPVVVIVNINKTWPEVEQGKRTAADVTLGDWNPYKSSSKTILAFNPDEVGLVLGYRKGTIITAFDIEEDGVRWLEHFDPHRVRWEGSPSAEWSHLVGKKSPVTWKQGEGVALKTLTLDELAHMTADPAPAPSGGTDASPEVTVSLGAVTVSLKDTQTVVVTAPDGMDVLVRRS